MNLKVSCSSAPQHCTSTFGDDQLYSTRLTSIVDTKTERNLKRKETNMLRWIVLIAAAFLGGKFIQDIVTNHDIDVWIARGAGILTVAMITLIGYVLFLKPVGEAR